MSVFLAVALLLALLAIFWLAKFWAKSPPSGTHEAENDDPEWQVMLARRREIEEDPLLSEETRTTLRNEWLATADSALSRAHQDSTAIPSRNSLWILSALVVLIAASLYATFGRLESDAMQFSASSQAMNAEREDMKKMQASLQESIDKLEEKLKKNPNDVEGMALLARSYFVLENYAAAARVLERLVQLRPRDPDAMADLADSLAASSPERTLAGRPISLVKAALAVNPRHPKSLALAATYAMQNNQTAEAIAYWKRLRALMPPDSEQQQRVDAILASMGVTPEAASTKSAKNDAAGNANKTITGTITLAPAIIAMAREGKLPADAVVFILARAAGSSGGPPLAAQRVPLAQVLAQAKYAFKLDDSLSMNPANKLSDAKSVDVEARIAIGGSVQKQAGDIRVIVKDIKPGQRALNLTLEPQS